MTDKCKTCKYWQRDSHGSGVQGYHTDGKHSNCRRHAPVFAGSETTDSIFAGRGTVWPVTAADDWCGDYDNDSHGANRGVSLGPIWP